MQFCHMVFILSYGIFLDGIYKYFQYHDNLQRLLEFKKIMSLRSKILTIEEPSLVRSSYIGRWEI